MRVMMMILQDEEQEDALAVPKLVLLNYSLEAQDDKPIYLLAGKCDPVLMDRPHEHIS
jgi:hypothetical protein